MEMAEPRRLEFTTIAPTQKPKKEVPCAPASQRFTLTLTDSTETTCPEFSYTELVKNAVVSPPNYTKISELDQYSTFIILIQCNFMFQL